MGSEEQREERRRHPRFAGGMVAVKFRRLGTLPSGEADVYHRGKLVDISKGGMCVETDHAITRGEQIEYYVSSVSGTGDREGTGRVVRVNREPDRFLVAVEFTT